MKTKFEQLREELLADISQIMQGESYLCVLYGSKKEEYDTTADMDVCIYAEKITMKQGVGIAEAVENLHSRNHLKIDFDMKYMNKTFFSREDIEELKKNSPFPRKEDGCIFFEPVRFEREFLDSPEMRLRLLLNIFTKNSELICGDRTEFEEIVKEMYDILLQYLMDSAKEKLQFSDLLRCLFGDVNKLNNYKCYLGYDCSDEEQVSYIKQNLQKAIVRKEEYRIIYITGASGAGTSSLGWMIQEQYDVNLIETDDITMYFTDPPYQYPRPQEERLPILRSMLSKDKVNVIVGSASHWGTEIIMKANIFILLYAPFEIRKERIRIREEQRFGKRLWEDSIIKNNYERLIKWTAQYDSFEEARSWKVHYELYQKHTGVKYLFDNKERCSEVFEIVKDKVKELIG